MALDSPERLFLEQLETIERAIRFACYRASLRNEEAEDFASYVKLKLIEKNYAVIRKYEGRASFAAFIGIVVQRMLLDYRVGQWGKWHASAGAKRSGEPAITIETLLHRDGRTLDEILPILLRRWPDLSREQVETIAHRLPPREPRARLVGLDGVGDTLLGRDDGAPFASDRAAVARRIARIVRQTMQGLEEHDRLIFRLHFETEMSVAEISRTLRIEQKPLYRRLQRALARLRTALHAGGIGAADAEEVLNGCHADLDFGFGGGTSASKPSPTDEEGT